MAAALMTNRLEGAASLNLTLALPPFLALCLLCLVLTVSVCLLSTSLCLSCLLSVYSACSLSASLQHSSSLACSPSASLTRSVCLALFISALPCSNSLAFSLSPFSFAYLSAWILLPLSWLVFVWSVFVEQLT